MINKTPRTLEDLAEHIRSEVPSLYVGSRTSTVIPYDISSFLIGIESIVDLSNLDKELRIDVKTKTIHIRGPITWGELISEARAKDLEACSWPTETDALVLSGLATSATGERSFHYGPIREHILEVEFLNYKGELTSLSADKSLGFESYTKTYLPFKDFKNAPFPRLEKQTDLMIGTEGQLGVIVSATMKLSEKKSSLFLALPLKPWKDSSGNFEEHIELYDFAQANRTKLLSVELLDSMSLLKTSEGLKNGVDYIVLEVIEDYLELIIEQLEGIKWLELESVIEFSASKFSEIRKAIPRSIQEENSRKGRVKKGTDAQVSKEDLVWLLGKYQQFSRLGIDYILFGHFGDAHLHFNFLPSSEEEKELCDSTLDEFYKELSLKKASPFAEHGIGLIKQDYIRHFLGEEHFSTFQVLKNEMDPKNIFFPTGFLNLGRVQK